MQRSSAPRRGPVGARLAGASVIAAITIASLPVPIAPDALAQSNILPAPILIPAATVEAQAQTTSTATKYATGSSVSGTVTGTVRPSTSSGTRLLIPSINLNDAIIPVGLTAGGAMAVPSGKSSNVGWYDGGPRPGDVGTAVLDAHVFAAFSKLNKLGVGDSIYVQENGRTLHFVVTATKLFPLSQITSRDLFTPTNARDLNLITCAGKLTADHSTYDHRLVIYATLAN